MLDSLNRQRFELIQDLDGALNQHQFVLHYQPKIDIASGATVGAEALVRWQDPTRGLLYPDAFLPVVEQNGLMNALTSLVLRAAVRQLVVWKEDGLDISIAVNLSASDLLDDSLADRIEALLREHSLPVAALELEITGASSCSTRSARGPSSRPCAGSGCESRSTPTAPATAALAYLRDLPVDELKLDRSFALRVTTDSRSAAIVRSTIELAHALGLQVVAEGVEDRQTLDALKSFGCDYAQGHYFSRPVPATAFAAAVHLAEVEPSAQAFPLAS